MSFLANVWKSSLGKKYAMALTGAILFLFAVGHLIGNLQVFGPPELINGYAHFLKSKPVLVWATRLGLLVAVGIHIAAAVTLSALSRRARPIPYASQTAYAATWASRYMFVSGLVIAAFIVYHLAHFTVLLPGINGIGDFRKLTARVGGEDVPDVYAMMLLGFQVWWVVAFYLLAQAMLFLHLGHGLSAMFQSLGFRDSVWWPRIQCSTRVASLALFLGYASIPVGIYLRLVGADYAEKKRFELRTTRTIGSESSMIVAIASTRAEAGPD